MNENNNLVQNKIAVIGGGISGVFSAIQLARNKYHVDLFEQRGKLLGGLPYCHLHTGGFLYPDTPISEIQNLFYSALAFEEYFSTCILRRPTVIAYNAHSDYTTDQLLHRCKIIKWLYTSTCKTVFGPPDQFYAVYDLETLEAKRSVSEYHDPYVYMVFEKLVDKTSIKYPIVSVCEFGIDQKAVEDQLKRELAEYSSLITVYYNQKIDRIEDREDRYVVNATGAGTAEPGDKIEYKTSFIFHGEPPTAAEVCIIGERGSQNGTLQLTPIPDGLQVHLMTPLSSMIQLGDPGDTLCTTSLDLRNRGLIALRAIRDQFAGYSRYTYKGSLGGIQRVRGSNVSSRASGYSIRGNVITLCTLKAMSIVKVVRDILQNLDI